MLTSLLAPKKSRSAKPLVEEIGMAKKMFILVIYVHNGIVVG